MASECVGIAEGKTNAGLWKFTFSFIIKHITYEKEEVKMLIVTTDYIEGKSLEMLGYVDGCTIQSKNAFKDMGQGFKSMIGGELKSYTDMMNKARGVAGQRMVEKAKQMGADAIVGVRFTSSSIMQGASEILAFGTAVKFK